MRFPQTGESFQGKYKLVDVLGRGGFAAVYKAVDIEIGREVAIKLLVPGEDGYEAGLVARFLREARVVAQLRDPHTITMFDFGRTDDGLLFMVFEYVAGADLAHILAQHGPLPPEIVIHVVDQLLGALREAHSAGVLHRDIKPANVLVYTYMEDQWQVKLLDFGIAKPGVGRSSDPVATLTQAGGILGTPRYMSPEQLCGDDLAAATDIYSLGLVAFEMLTGRPAIDGRDTRDNLVKQLSDEPLVFGPQSTVPPRLRAVVERMMARAQGARYQTAYEVQQALAALSSPTTQRGPAVNRGPKIELSTPVLIGLGLALGAAVVVPLALLSGDGPVDQPPAARLAPRMSTLLKTQPARPAEPAAPTAPEPDPPDLGQSAKSGCERSATPGLSTHSVTFGLTSRTWTTYTPESYAPPKKLPLLLLFHDRTRSAQRMLADTEFMPLADEQGFIIAALDGSDYTHPWHAKQDLEFIDTAIRRTAESLCVDRSRIYAVGHNVAGKLVEELACLMPLSGIATTAYRGEAQLSCKPIVPVPHIHLVGIRNRYLPSKGGTGCDGKSVVALSAKEDAWFAENECAGERERYLKDGNNVCWTKHCKSAAFVSCRLDGGRDWPKASARDWELPHCAVPPAQFPYAKTIWDFFSKYGQPVEPPT